MPLIPKSFSKNPTRTGVDVIYTAAVGVTFGAIIAATTNAAARTVDIGILRAGTGVRDWLSRNIPIAAGASGKAVPAQVNLNAGDKLIALSKEAAVGQFVNGANSFSPWPSVPRLLLANADGSVLAAVCGNNGIWISTDGQQSAQLVRAGALVGPYVGAFFAGKFHIYTSATGKLEGTADGLTWTAVACTNAPQHPDINAFGSMIVKGAELYGVNAGGTQLFKSTDGTNFTAHGAAFPPGTTGTVKGLVWTGTNWVVAISYSSTYGTYFAPAAAASWGTSASAPAGTMNGCLANIGGTVVSTMAGGSNPGYSVDHGATFYADTSVVVYSQGTGIVSTGAAFLMSNNSAAELVSPSGLPGTWRTFGNNNDGFISTSAMGRLGASNTAAFALLPAKLIGPAVESADLALTPRGGLTVTASNLEAA